MKSLLCLFHAPAGEGAGLELLIDDVVILGVELVVVLLGVGLLDPYRLEPSCKAVGKGIVFVGLLPLA